MSDKDKEVASCEMRVASKEIKYQEGYRLQDARYKNSLPVGQSTGLPVKKIQDIRIGFGLQVAGYRLRCKIQDKSASVAKAMTEKKDELVELF